MAEPHLVWVPVLLDEDGRIFHEAGGFPEESMAQDVLTVWTAEGRTESMGVNIIPLYESVEQWQVDR
jgi:hypothetical protein